MAAPLRTEIVGVEGESSKNNGADVGAGFGLEYFANGTAPDIGAIGFGSSEGLAGRETDPGTSSSHGYGVVGFDGQDAASSQDTAMLAEANGQPHPGIFSTATIGVFSVADKVKGKPAGASYAFFGQSNNIGLALGDTTSGSKTYVNESPYFLLGSAQPSSSGSYDITYAGNEFLSGTLTTSKGGPYVRATGSSGAAMRQYGARSTVPNVEDFGEASFPAVARSFRSMHGSATRSIIARRIWCS